MKNNDVVFHGLNPFNLDEMRTDITHALQSLPVLPESALLRPPWAASLKNDIFKRIHCDPLADFLIQHVKNDAETASLFVPEVQSMTVDCEFNAWKDIRVLSVSLLLHGASYFLPHNVCRYGPDQFEICYHPPEEVVRDVDLREMRKLARQLLETHGGLLEVKFISKRNPCRIDMVFADGHEISVGDPSGRLDIPLMTFGYKGTGPSCFHLFLRDAGIPLSYDEISQIVPGTILHPSKENTAVTEVLLLKGAVNVRHTRDDGKTPLHIAAEKGELTILEYLLTKVDDINSRDPYGRTPLHIAAEKGHAEIVSALLSRGADVSAKADNGETPLHGAAKEGHTAIVKVLLHKGAEVDARGYMDRTPLMVAADSNTDTVNALLSQGADVNAKTDNGMTPLMWAARAGQAKTVKVLLSKGADVNAKTSDDNKTAMYYAEFFSHKETVRLLKAAGAREGAKNTQTTQEEKQPATEKTQPIQKQKGKKWWQVCQ